MIRPRKVVSWDIHFMSRAQLAAQDRSRDPSTQVGCIIVNDQNVPVATGYNGLPRGCDNDKYPWNREGEVLDTKYPYVEHAERNAINNRGSNSLQGTRLYVTLHPCSDCAKGIIQNGIKEVIYLSDKYADSPDTLAAKRMFADCGVKTRQLILDEPYVVTIELKNE